MKKAIALTLVPMCALLLVMCVCATSLLTDTADTLTGYILTDTIDTDSWTTLQIIGCVLIAINVGLLILILRFKRNSIGTNGSKYLEIENKQKFKKCKNIEKTTEKRA